MIIRIPGNVIAKKNSQMVVKFGNHSSIRPSKAYTKFANQAVSHLYGQPEWPGNYPVIVEMFFFRESRRKFDLDNMQGSILDVLVNAGILKDDSMTHVIPKIYKHGWDVDKNNPRSVVKIYEYPLTTEV